MKEPNAHIVIEGHGVKPSTPRPLPTFLRPGRIIEVDVFRGQRGNGSAPETAPSSPPRGNGRQG